jgi:gamma-glutamyltranspeptidase / glutathione hydrolase
MSHYLNNPYPSRRSPLLAKNVVSTSQPLASQAGLRMLLKGGNAIDAALATAITLTVVEPCSNGIGSDLYALVWSAGELHGLNASGRSPAGWTPDYFSQLMQGSKPKPERGWHSVSIPGCVSGWVALSNRFGKLPFADLFAPAIDYARNGYPVSPTVARQWAANTELLRHQPGFADTFLPNGRAPLAGELFRSAVMANTLNEIAQSKGESYYRGRLAQAMADSAQAHGAAHTAADFANHTCDWVTPLRQSYRGFEVCEIPPNGQGIAALIALGILQHFDAKSWGADSTQRWHMQIEAMKLAFADIYAHVADINAMTRVTPDHLLDPAYLKQRAALINPNKAQHFGTGLPPQGGTIYLSTADENGMMVSLIQSNYMGFGSGVVVEGISLQNRGYGFSLDPNHQNVVAPNKRPFQTIIPAFSLKDGQPHAAFGVMGGPMQPQGHMQTFMSLVDYGHNPQAVQDAPRWKVDATGAVELESSCPPEVRASLAAMGHQIIEGNDSYMDFGCGQMIVKTEHGYAVGADPRKDSVAVGY